MFEREQSILVEALPEAVFDYVADFRRHPEWASQKMEIHVEPVGATAVGTAFTTTVQAFGKVEARGRVVTVERPRRLQYEAEDSSGHYRWTFDVRPDGKGARLSHRFERLSAPAWFKVVQMATYPLVGKAMLGNGLANIKKNVEAAQKQPSA